MSRSIWLQTLGAVSKKQSDKGCLLYGGLFDPQSSQAVYKGQTLPPNVRWCALTSHMQAKQQQ